MIRRGFTVVELLIVIVVIGILATLTIIAYSGVQNNARTAVLKSDAEQASKKLQEYKIRNGEVYPVSQTLAETGAGIKASPNTTLTYYPTWTSGSAGGYCVESRSTQNTALVQSASSGAPTPVSVPCIQNNMVGWWPLNGNANDATAAGNNGTVTNATLATGQGGQANTAYSFNGTNTSIAMTKQLMSNEMTLSVWYNPASLSVANAGHILYASESTGDGFGGEFETHISHQTGDTYAMFVKSGACQVGVSAGAITLGWHQIVMTISTADKRLSAYIDGAPAGTWTLGCALDFSTYQDMLWIGRPANSTRYANGLIDDVRVYGRALSATEAANLYAAGAQ